MLGNPKYPKNVLAKFSDFDNVLFRPANKKPIDPYIVWLFNICEISIINPIFPKGFFSKSNETTENTNLKWGMFTYRINVANSQNKSINTKNISFEYNLEEASEKTNKYLNNYLEQIEKNQIITASNYKIFEKQKMEVISKIIEKHQKTGRNKLLLNLDEFEDPDGINFVDMCLIFERQDYLKINYFKDDYKSIYLDMKDKILENSTAKQEVLEAKPITEALTAPDNNRIEILFNKNLGILYREPKSEFCHEFRKDSKLFKITAMLIDKKGNFYETNKIQGDIDSFNTTQVRKLIIKLRSTLQKNLKIKNFIEGQATKGYRINTMEFNVVITEE